MAKAPRPWTVERSQTTGGMMIHDALGHCLMRQLPHQLIEMDEEDWREIVTCVNQRARLTMDWA